MNYTEKRLHDTIKSHGGVGATHRTVNTHNTQAINLQPTGDRSHWSTEQKVAMNFLQLLQTKGIEKSNISGHNEIVQKCDDLTDSIKSALAQILE